MARSPKLSKTLAATLLAVTLAGGTYQDMTRETLLHVEAIRYTPYRDVVGVWTVCVGHTGRDIQLRRYSHAECMALLDADLVPVYAALDRLVTVPLTPYQRTALATFVFNTGVAAFSGSTLLKKLNAGDFEGPQHHKDTGMVTEIILCVWPWLVSLLGGAMAMCSGPCAAPLRAPSAWSVWKTD